MSNDHGQHQPTTMQPAVPVLEYGHPDVAQRHVCARSLSWMILASIFVHLLVLAFYAATLDGGVTAKRCSAVSIGYWLIAALIFWRRRFTPSWLDLFFVGFGYPVMLLIAEWFVKM